MQVFTRARPTLLNAAATTLSSTTGTARHASSGRASSESTEVGPVSKAVYTLRRVQKLYESPAALSDATTILLKEKETIEKPHIPFDFVKAFERAPFVPDRWEKVRALREAITTPDYTRSLIAPLTASPPTSHASGLEALHKLKQQQGETVEDTLARALGVVLRWRFPDAPFAPFSALADILSEYSSQTRERGIQRYLLVIIENAYMTRALWEREALAARGSSSDAVFASAVETVRAVEQYLGSHAPEALKNTHGELLKAYAALRAPTADALRHWSYLVQQRSVDPAIFDAALRSARDGATIARIDSEWSASVRQEKVYDIAISRHYARLGLLDDAARAVSGNQLNAIWTYWARRGEQSTHRRANSNVQRFNLLTASGFDINDAEWLLGCYPAFTRLFSRKQPSRST